MFWTQIKDHTKVWKEFILCTRTEIFIIRFWKIVDMGHLEIYFWTFSFKLFCFVLFLVLSNVMYKIQAICYKRRLCKISTLKQFFFQLAYDLQYSPHHDHNPPTRVQTVIVVLVPSQKTREQFVCSTRYILDIYANFINKLNRSSKMC